MSESHNGNQPTIRPDNLTPPQKGPSYKPLKKYTCDGKELITIQLNENTENKVIFFRDKKGIEFVADHYGRESQFRQLAEECAELAQASLKAIRANYDDESSNNVLMEIADVLIMIMQISHFLGFETYMLESMVTFKLTRQLKRIREEENNV